MRIIALIIPLVSLLYGQSQENFLGNWTGLENLNSPSMSYDNRNLSIIISEGGDREAISYILHPVIFCTMKIFLGPTIILGSTKIPVKFFLRRFITPLGLLGFEELAYEIIDWSTDFL